MNAPILPQAKSEDAITQTMQYQVEVVKLLNHMAGSLATIAKALDAIAKKQP